jgi:hypothetical protein
MLGSDAKELPLLAAAVQALICQLWQNRVGRQRSLQGKCWLTLCYCQGGS